MLRNRFGHFSADGRVFSITDPGTPTPWTNVVANPRYGFVLSQNGGGFSWHDNSQLNVLTRWEMDLVRDAHGKFLYLADLDTNDAWSLAPTPCRPAYAAYRCDHTQGSTTFTTEHQGVRAVWTMAVAPDDPVELWTVELTNNTAQPPYPRRLRIASFFEWCCGVAPDVKREFHRLFFTTSHDPARRAILARKNMWDVPARDEKEHWNRPWPYVAAHAVVAPDGLFDHHLAIADKALFLGRYADPARPAAMTLERPPSTADSGFGRFGDAAAALGGDFQLLPGQTVRLAYLLAIAPDENSALSLIDRYASPGAPAEAVARSTQAWQDRLALTSIETERPDFDLLNNHWLPYQAISGRLWGRTGYYQQSGAFGFRDQLQDSHVWLPLDPARCREQILLHAAHQFTDGSVYHWWHPLTETGLRTACSDDYLWLPFVTVSYLKETGDFDILKEPCPFVDDPDGAPLLEHCRRAFARSFARTSPRGLPHIGSCDWNDGLSALGVEGRGESVWLAFFLVGLLDDFATVLQRAGDAPTAAEYRARRERLIAAANEHAWDGAWFRRATRDDGRWIGSKDNTEGRIFLNAQTWAILTNATDPERTAAAWASVKEHLLADMGPLLLAPAYTQPDPGIGYITRYAPGLRENGGVYMHAATWALAAACARKDTQAVEQIWHAISPPARCSAPPTHPTPDTRNPGVGNRHLASGIRNSRPQTPDPRPQAPAVGPDAYRAEPYVTPGNVDGPQSELPGRAGWTWYTGSAAWLNRVSLERVLGIRPTWDGLLIDPCPFPALGRVDVTRTWRGRQIRLRFDAHAYAPNVPPRLTLNGDPIQGNMLTPAHAADHRARPIEVDIAWDTLTPPTRPALAIETRTATAATRRTAP